jgi:CMP-N,N'-diacetyllegionaminic acid synthase
MKEREDMEILGIVPARGGSKGIPGKNLVPLCGKPLIAWTIESARESRLLTRTVLSSDSDDIIHVAEEHGLEVPFVRPAELAEDDTPALPVIQHAVRTLEQGGGYRPDYVVILQPTSPLRTSQHIDQSLAELTASDADSLVSVVQAPHRFCPHSVMRLEGEHLVPFMNYDERDNLRQKKPVFYGRNGAAIYAFTYDCLMKKNSLYGDIILPYIMSTEDSLDIDEPLDVALCEFILKRRSSG